MSTTPISVQLYSLREQAAHDFPAVLARLGAAGFVGVELAGFNHLTLVEFKRCIDDAGLVVSSAHVASGDGFAATLADVQSVGCSTVVIPFVPPDGFTDLDAIKRTADMLNVSNEIARAAGATLGYHNHWWEFEQIFEGRSAFLHLYDHLTDDIFVELDCYWTKVGGADPIEVITTFGDRVRLLHVKDGPADLPESSMVAVGSGSVDIPAVLAAAPHAAWHVVELDRCDTDMFDAVEASYRYLVGNGLSRGRK
jgi:sugar phosphate isomerase/epimerase